MTDVAFHLLQPKIDNANGVTLWIADENALRPQQLASPNPAITVICNRFDLYQKLDTHGWNVEFNDFDFSAYPDGSVDRIVYRISKEKPAVHHIINQAFRVLKQDGELCISGLKNEGIKTYLDKAKKFFAGQIETKKADKNTWMGTLRRPEAGKEPLDDQHYTELREVATDDAFSYWSKPGVFGWNKIDKGSTFLIEELQLFVSQLKEPPENILDLGCGYGYLSLNCQLPGAKITATDNNAAAIYTCTENFLRNQVNGEVITADCAEGIEQQFSLILCNPPFHQGFSVEGDMTDRFLNTASKRLHAKGIACFVVNLHIPLERKAKGLFSRIETIAGNGSFKLVLLAQPVTR
ncbi:MAG: methyltransferase [Amphritea sp.]